MTSSVLAARARGVGLRATTRARRWSEPLTGVRQRVSSLIRVVRPYLTVVSPLGWAAAVVAVVLFVIGRDEGWVEFRAISVACAVALVAGLVMSLDRPRYEVEIDLDRSRVKVGDEVLGQVRVRKIKGRSVFSGTFELPVGRGTANFALPSLSAGEEHPEVFAIPARRRSVVPIGPARSVQGDPLGLIRRVQRWSGITELYIHPATTPLGSGTAGLMRDIEGVATTKISQSDISFHGLRPYAIGDHQRSIHWRTTARVGDLMVRQYEETRRVHMLVLLSVRAEDYATDDEFELAVSVAASLGLLAFREERQLSFVTQAGVFATPNGTVLLDQCSTIEAVSGADGLGVLANTAVSRVPSASVVAVVTGSTPPVTELRAADVAIPFDARSFAVRCDAETPVRRRAVGRTTVLDVPTLDDLRRAVRGI